MKIKDRHRREKGESTISAARFTVMRSSAFAEEDSLIMGTA